MNGLIELIFENVPDNKLDELVHDLLYRTAIIKLSHSDLGNLDPKIVSESFIQLLKSRTEPSTVSILSSHINVGAIPINDPLLTILRFDGANEVTISFNSTDIHATHSQSTIKELIKGAGQFARIGEVINYYCGFEPANDERTRLFTKGVLGPLTNF